MDNKKTILKKEIKKVSNPNIYSADQIRKIRMDDDIQEMNKIKIKKIPSPLNMVGTAIKRGIKTFSDQKKLDAEAYRIQKEERGGPVSSNEGNVSEFLKIRKRLKEEKKKNIE